MATSKRKYTKEFKKDAVQLFRKSGKTITAIAKELGIRHDLLSRWNREMDKENAFPGNGNARDSEIYEYKKRIKELEEERDILKKAMAIFSRK